jgi:hypothetical protein
LRQNNGEPYCPVQGEDAMKFLFGRREKFLYRRNPVYASFLSGTKFGLALSALVYLVIKLG